MNFDKKDIEGDIKTFYDEEGYDIYGFDRKGKHRETETLYDPNGYNKYGYNVSGDDRKGFNSTTRKHRETGTLYDPNGYDKYGYDKFGYDRRGFNSYTGKHRETRTFYDSQGYDREGFNRAGYDKDGFTRDGKTKEEIKDQNTRNYLGLIRKATKLANGEMTVEEYIKKSKTSLEDLIKFAKKQNMPPEVIRSLFAKKTEYNRYKVPFSKKEYLESVVFEINDALVKPKEEDIDKCLEYMRINDIYICRYNFSNTIKQYLEGELDLSLEGKEISAQEVGKAGFGADTEMCDKVSEALNREIKNERENEQSQDKK